MLKDEFCTHEPLGCVILRGQVENVANDVKTSTKNK